MPISFGAIARRQIIFLELISVASVLLFSRFPLVQSAALQVTKRSFENGIPPYVPLKVKIKESKEEKALDLKNKNWFRDIEIEVTNTSDKPIYFILLNLEMPDLVRDDGALAIFPMRYGNSDLIEQNAKPRPEDVPIEPKATYTFVVDDKNRIGYEAWRTENNREDPQKLRVRLNHLSYGDGTGFTSLSAVPFPVKNSLKNSVGLWRSLDRSVLTTSLSKRSSPHAILSTSFSKTRDYCPDINRRYYAASVFKLRVSPTCRATSNEALI